MDNRLTIILASVISFILGMFIYEKFFVPESETTYKETVVVDTTYRHYKEKYLVDSIKRVSLLDSVNFYKRKYAQKLKDRNIEIIPEPEENEPFSAPLRKFTGQQPFLYGNTYFNATVAGELLDMEITNDFKIPTITNTLTKETRTVIQPSGLYGTFGFRAGDQQLSPLIGATYLKNKSMIFYQYDLKLKSHQAGIGVKVFGR